MMVYVFLLFVSVVFGVIAQLSLKYGVDKAGIQRFRSLSLVQLFKRFFNIPVIIGFGTYGVSTLLWLVILSKLELSYAYPMAASGYFFVALFSNVLFKEKISKQRWFSIFVIIFGVVLIGFS